jgi:hypothetical protein
MKNLKSEIKIEKKWKWNWKRKMKMKMNECNLQDEKKWCRWGGCECRREFALRRMKMRRRERDFVVWNENLDFKQVSQTSSHTQQNERKSLCQLQLYSTSLFFFSLSFLFYFIFLLIISERKKKLYKKTSLKKTTKNWLFYNNYHIFFCQNGYFRFLILIFLWH